MPVGEIKTHKIYIKAMTTPYLGSYLGYMFVRSKTKPSLLIDEGGKKIMFVKSVSRSDECKAICLGKAIHHGLRRQSRGKSEKRQTNMSD